MTGTMTWMRSASLAVLAGLLGAAPSARSGVDSAHDWTTRLEALEPSRPEAYFELAEEVADAADGADARALARRLYALAGVLAGQDPSGLGRSACLALADLEPDDAARRRYVALAELLDDHGAFHGTIDAAPHDELQTIDPAAALAVAEALGFYRLGAGARALAALDEDGAMDLLRRHAAFLHGGIDRFIEDCRLYRGRVRPSLSAAAVTNLVQLEIALLAGADRSWRDQLTVAGPTVLVEVDPSHLDEALEVNPGLCVWRDGRWVAP